MSITKNRTQSLPNRKGVTFSIGDGVHYSLGGDSYPGTVRRISDSGRQIWISSDDKRITQKEMEEVRKYGMHEGNVSCVFIPVDVPEDQWTMFKLNKHGHFQQYKNQGDSAFGALQPGRIYSQDPSF